MNNPDTSLPSSASQRNYAGFGAQSIKMIWEQHDTSDTAVSGDVYARLAEDATYKVWKLVNCIKTYCRHSGGKVTYDLVNEVLKDSDVPPILGAGDTDWDRSVFTGYFFFNSDKILLLHDEYLNEVQSSRKVLPDIVSSWAIDRRFERNLFEFVSFLCNAIFLGDEEAYKYAIDTAAFSPHVGCSLNLLLKKAIEIMAFEQKPQTMDRCLAFLRAISVNPHTRDANCSEQLFHLSEILVCLLLGTYESISLLGSTDEKIKKKDDTQVLQYEYEEGNLNKIEDIKVESSPMHDEKIIHQDKRIKKDDETQAPQNVYEEGNLNKAEDIKVESSPMHDEQIIQQDKRMKKEDETQVPQDVYEEGNLNKVEDIKVESAPIQDEKIIQQAEHVTRQELKEDEKQDPDTEFSPYVTEMCDFKQVDNVCATIGCLGSQFVFLQNECTFLIHRRLEQCFEFEDYPTSKDYEYISRAVRGLISLGEYAFREMIPFLDKINPELMPEWMENDFAPAAVFLHGREDIFLYEWLEDLCGYKLQPFMLHFYNYTQKLENRLHKRRREITYRIKPKLTMQTLKTVHRKPTSSKFYDPEDDAEGIPLKKRKINIKIAGIRPLISKVKMSRNDRTFAMQLPSFRYAAVIGKRKLFKPLSDKPKIVHVSNYCFLQL